MSDEEDDLEVYIFRGNKREKVPRIVLKLVVNEGVQVLPDDLCRADYDRLEEVTLPKGLKEIGNQTFAWCESLLEISICNTVQRIGREAFRNCKLLKKVEFEYSKASPHQLQTIDEGAFMFCDSLSRIKLPSSVNTLGEHIFHGCESLSEANLSATSVTEIPDYTFHNCYELQTASLPNTVFRIGEYAFYMCCRLKTVVVPLDSPPISIEHQCFVHCSQLTNVVLPKHSTAEGDSFSLCYDLPVKLRCSDFCFEIVAGLERRFDDFPIHRMCYDQSATTVEDLQQCIANHQGGALVDMFSLNPFHIFFSSSEPRADLLEVLLESLPHWLLKGKDDVGDRPLDFLIANWTHESTGLFQMTVQKWIIEPFLVKWSAKAWMKTTQSMVQDILAEDDKSERNTIWCRLFAKLEYYDNVYATSMLEMALWKWNLKSGWRRTTDDAKRTTRYGIKRQALDRDECRFLSGSFVIPNVVAFLNIPSGAQAD